MGGAQLGSHNRQHTAARPHIQHCIAGPHQFFQRGDTQPRAGVQPCTKRHARVQFYNDVIRLRDVFLLLGFNTMRLPMRMGL